jgi:hypothetical protein
MYRRMLEVNAQTFVHNYPWHGLLTDTLHLHILFPSSVDISLKRMSLMQQFTYQLHIDINYNPIKLVN